MVADEIYKNSNLVRLRFTVLFRFVFIKLNHWLGVFLIDTKIIQGNIRIRSTYLVNFHTRLDSFLKMANEEEMESFDVSERDLCDAFQPGQRRFKKMTKNQQIYGVFDEDEGENFTQRSTSSSGRSNFSKSSTSKDYTTPVDFVKGGVQQGSKKEKLLEKKNKLFSYSERYAIK